MSVFVPVFGIVPALTIFNTFVNGFNSLIRSSLLTCTRNVTFLALRCLIYVIAAGCRENQEEEEEE